MKSQVVIGDVVARVKHHWVFNRRVNRAEGRPLRG